MPPAKQLDRLDPAQLSNMKGAFDGKVRRVSGSKRKMEEDEAQTSSKRPRTDKITDAENVEKPAPDFNDSLPFFRARAQPIIRSVPHCSSDLIAQYDLNDVAASLARKDATGEKINKLRKSYENYVKDVPGRNKIRREDKELRNLSMYPDEDYYNTNVHGKEISLGLSEDLLGKLAKATKIDGAPLPAVEDKKWKDTIEAESISRPQLAPAANVKKMPDTAPPASSLSATANDSMRSRRGVKRRYHDEAFEGYAESFGDDTGEAASSNVADDGDAGSTAKRKKRRVGRPPKNEAVTPTAPNAPTSAPRICFTRKPDKR
ncbi:MAG: hypothetical protein Q9162_003616 [Coniocarpon cinnabarinum]